MRSARQVISLTVGLGALFFAASVSLTGCVYDELLATHVEPGGSVKAQMNGGVEMESTAIGHGQKEPLDVSGFSANLTFGLTAGDDTGGSTAYVDLQKANVAVALPITPTGRTRLEIHLAGSGCVAESGTVNLRTDGDKNLSGDFQADGTLPDGVTPCQMAGTLDKIPVER